MHVLKIEGDHYTIGRRIGERSRATFGEYIMQSDGFLRLLPWRDSEWMDCVAAMSRARIPQVWRELEGLADGCGQDIRDVLLWNTRGDIMPTGPEGCSSVALRRRDDGLLCHNEDGDPNLRAACFILDAKLVDGPRILSFAYPGSIPGHTFGLNSHGLAYTVNNIRLVKQMVGLPRMLISRALLETASSQDFIALLQNEQRSGGFHYMVADCAERSPYSVEAPGQGVEVEPLSSVAVHANHLVMPGFTAVEQLITASSRARQERLEVLSAPLSDRSTEQDLLAVLSDQDNTALPIYRTSPDDPDMENTLATCVFRLTDEGVDVSVHARPDGPKVYGAFLRRD